MKVEIITIGDELLIGQVIDTNSAWIGRELNKIGWEVSRITTVADQEKALTEAFDMALADSDIVLVTGGIGPTNDDITKKTLCRYFGGTLVLSHDVLDNIEELLKGRSISLNELTRSQAMVPDNCIILQNQRGTAPCTWFERNGKVLVSMPGVPAEMTWLMKNEVLPRLQKTFNDGSVIKHQTFMVMNFTESALAEYLSDFEASLPEFVSMAYLPAPGVIRLRLTGRSTNRHELSQDMKRLTGQLSELLGKNLFCLEDLSLAEVVGQLLSKHNLQLSTAESCTGGHIAHCITQVAGSSAYYKGSVVAYANEVKEELLGVPHAIILTHGVVSEPVVRLMAEGVSRLLHTGCAIATSGVAGPTGGTDEKPVGAVWISVKVNDISEAKCFTFGKNREYNIQRSTNAALLMLIELLATLEKK